jgi:xylan 1,4-beta-xylosidase
MVMQSRGPLVVCVALVLLTGGPAAPAAARAHAALTATVRADFADPIRGRPSMSGFLLSMTGDRPPDSVVRPLRPRLIRHRDPAIWSRAQALGARLELIVSDGWGYPRQNWLGKGPPYADFARWEAFVRSLAARTRGMSIAWDIWNEPDGAFFWSGTRRQLFETYLRAYRVLRAELGPDAMIGGPSITSYNRSYLAAFLEFCRANGCEVNFLSWHDNRSAGEDISTVASDLADARRSFIENPAYRSLRIQELHVNEYLGRAGQYRPADIVAFLTYLEHGGADAAAKSCWPDEAGVRNANCVNNTLDGIVTPASFAPRAAWWTYKLYADGAATRVASTSSDRRVVALASRRSARAHTAQVLLAAWPSGATPGRADVSLELANLSSLRFVGRRKRVQVAVSRVPSTGELALPQPVPVMSRRLKARRGTARLDLPGLALFDAYLVTVRRVPGRRTTAQPRPR